jgi:gamma-glutamyltranspeptidase/glutathione hydrolase
MASNIVATSQPLAAQAGLHILRSGGNAVDAAVATAAVMAVVEPCSNGLGADNFAIVWHQGKLHGLNASGRAPKAMTLDRFTGQSKMPERGWDTVTVPGVVSGWVALSKKFGKLPFAKLLEPAIHYASDGFPVAPLTSGLWAKSEPLFGNKPEFAKLFLPNGKAPAPGQRFVNTALARSLHRVADSEGEDYYHGELAQHIVDHAKATGGLFTPEDFSSHHADWIEPISVDYHGTTVHELPPNGQGLAALQALAILQHHDVRNFDPDCPDVLHLGIEAMKLAFADAHQHIADPAYMRVKVEQLLDPDYIKERAALINPDRASDPNFGTPKPGGTILLTAADSEGAMVTLIQSNYLGFGSGVVIPNTGIHLQNRGACFVLTPGHINQIAGGKRPYHTIIPAFMTRKTNAGEEPVMAFGVMGGFMQPQGHMQVASRFIDFHQNPQAALDAPRWQVRIDKTVWIEPGFAPSVYEDLTRRGHKLVHQPRTIEFGSGQAILKLKDSYTAASDCRHDGQAVGF